MPRHDDSTEPAGSVAQTLADAALSNMQVSNRDQNLPKAVAEPPAPVAAEPKTPVATETPAGNVRTSQSESASLAAAEKLASASATDWQAGLAVMRERQAVAGESAWRESRNATRGEEAAIGVSLGQQAAARATQPYDAFMAAERTLADPAINQEQRAAAEQARTAAVAGMSPQDQELAGGISQARETGMAAAEQAATLKSGTQYEGLTKQAQAKQAEAEKAHQQIAKDTRAGNAAALGIKDEKRYGGLMKAATSKDEKAAAQATRELENQVYGEVQAHGTEGAKNTDAYKALQAVQTTKAVDAKQAAEAKARGGAESAQPSGPRDVAFGAAAIQQSGAGGGQTDMLLQQILGELIKLNNG